MVNWIFHENAELQKFKYDLYSHPYKYLIAKTFSYRYLWQQRNVQNVPRQTAIYYSDFCHNQIKLFFFVILDKKIGLKTKDCVCCSYRTSSYCNGNFRAVNHKKKRFQTTWRGRLQTLFHHYTMVGHESWDYFNEAIKSSGNGTKITSYKDY